MDKKNKNKSMDDILRDIKHNSKAQEVFLKLLSKQKLGINPFDEARTFTTPSMRETKPGPDYA